MSATALNLGLEPDVTSRVAEYVPQTRAPAVPGRPLVAFDLDRTVIYSVAALLLPADAPRLAVAEIYLGAPSSFVTLTALSLLTAIGAVATTMPVTTRTVAQYARVRLSNAPPPYAVTSNGGRILVGGVIDEDWSRQVDAALAGECAPLGPVTDHLRRICTPDWSHTVRTADGLFCYTVVDRPALPAAVVEELTAWCDRVGWTVSLQGRKLYCVPRPLTKSAAVTEIRHRIDPGPLYAAGDSLLDAGLLDTADHAFRPAHGELHDTAWHRPHLTVTDTRGVLAGEELLARMLALAMPR